MPSVCKSSVHIGQKTSHVFCCTQAFDMQTNKQNRHEDHDGHHDQQWLYKKVNISIPCRMSAENSLKNVAVVNFHERF